MNHLPPSACTGRPSAAGASWALTAGIALLALNWTERGVYVVL